MKLRVYDLYDVYEHLSAFFVYRPVGLQLISQVAYQNIKFGTTSNIL